MTQTCLRISSNCKPKGPSDGTAKALGTGWLSLVAKILAVSAVRSTGSESNASALQHEDAQ
jgi:hypothetical protein